MTTITYLDKHKKQYFSMNHHFYIFLVCSTLLCCKSETQIKTPEANYQNKKVSIQHNIPYNLDKVDQTYELETGLKEISGLAYYDKKNCLVTHNDEKGNYYEIDINNGKVLQKVRFSKSGDYEGITLANNNVILSKSNGTLYFYDTNTQSTITHKTKLNSKNDIEGLCYNVSDNTLLMASKSTYKDGDKSTKTNLIYSYDIKNKKLKETPYLKIVIDDLQDWLQEDSTKDTHISLVKQMKRLKNFAPSGLSFSNDNNTLYIVSARGSTLLIYNIIPKNGVDPSKQKIELDHIHFLDQKVMPQPEGICFDSNQNLYISTEGQNTKGKILKFNYLK